MLICARVAMSGRGQTNDELEVQAILLTGTMLPTSTAIFMMISTTTTTTTSHGLASRGGGGWGAITTQPISQRRL